MANTASKSSATNGRSSNRSVSMGPASSKGVNAATRYPPAVSGADEGLEQLTHQRVDAIADRTYLGDRQAGRVGEVPVEVTLAGEDRTGIAASHRDDDICV